MHTRPEELIIFKPLVEGDFPLLHKWLNLPLLVSIWQNGKSASYDDVESKYLPRIRGEEPINCFIIRYGGVPIGYVQTYLWQDYSEYSQYFLQDERNGASLDIFIAEEDYRGIGLAPVIINSFLNNVVFKLYESETCVITPLAENKKAIRAYEKAGFRKVRTLDHPSEPSTVMLMRYNKAQRMQ